MLYFLHKVDRRKYPHGGGYLKPAVTEFAAGKQEYPHPVCTVLGWDVLVFACSKFRERGFWISPPRGGISCDQCSSAMKEKYK